MIFLHCAQGSPEWNAARVGNIGASEFKHIITSKGEPTSNTVRERILYKLAGEIIRGEKEETYKNEYMQKGNDREDESRKLYEMLNDCDVLQVGMVYLDEEKRFHASPDGLVGEIGGYETKNAESHIQIARLLKGWPKSEHYQQVQGCLYVCEREWWDLMSYSRGLKPLIIRYERDEDFISKLRDELDKFCLALSLTVRKLKEMQ